MNYEIIDFHTHPFTEIHNNICNHIKYCDMSVENTVNYLKSLGFTKICGSAICSSKIHKYDQYGKTYECDWDMIEASNQTTFLLKEQYGDFFIPGFHIHPAYVQKSCDLMEEMGKKGVRLIGELVPYLHGWCDYSCKAFDEILDVATEYHMVVSIHTDRPQEMDEMVKKHPKTVFVAAHPGEADTFARHLKRMEWSDNYYLDLSGSGLHRHGLLRHGIDEFGAERFIFGTDYPICNPAMFLGGVFLDTMLTHREKKLILADNAKRLLGL